MRAAFADRKPWRLDTNIATPDHNISTDKTERDAGVAGMTDEVSRIQVQTLDDNCDLYGIKEFKINEMGQGIVHVMGPELGATMPGMTVVCGDSHTATHGAWPVWPMVLVPLKLSMCWRLSVWWPRR